MSKDPVEWQIAAAGESSSGCTIEDPIDAYRWNLFDTSLDDESVTRWSQSAMARVDTATPFR